MSRVWFVPNFVDFGTSFEVEKLLVTVLGCSGLKLISESSKITEINESDISECLVYGQDILSFDISMNDLFGVKLAKTGKVWRTKKWNRKPARVCF